MYWNVTLVQNKPAAADLAFNYKLRKSVETDDFKKTNGTDGLISRDFVIDIGFFFKYVKSFITL